MDKDVHPYKQRKDTCAIACMLMVLEYYKVIEKANWYDEKRYYRLYGSKYVVGTPFSALAYHFSKNGLNTKIYHSDKELFNNDKKVFDDYDFQQVMTEYKEYLKRAEEKKTKVINGVEVNTKLLKEELMKDNLIILAGQISNGYHAILLTGYKDNKFIVCDPLYKEKQQRNEEEIESFMDTNIGKWFISVNKK